MRQCEVRVSDRSNKVRALRVRTFDALCLNPSDQCDTPQAPVNIMFFLCIFVVFFSYCHPFKLVIIFVMPKIVTVSVTSYMRTAGPMTYCRRGSLQRDCGSVVSLSVGKGGPAVEVACDL